MTRIFCLIISFCAVFGHENNVCSKYEDYYTIKVNPNCWFDIAATGNATDIIIYYGYPVEVHKVVTPDKYILTVFRIPNDRFGNKRKAPVLLQHGWFHSAAGYLGLRKNSLAFLLANEGYDVWLGNFRGNEYAEEHLELTVDDNKFWDYRLDQLGLYDIDSELEYIAKLTGQRGKIIYIGHSLGTLSSYIYASAYPQKAKETVKLFISLAPGSSLRNTKARLFRILDPIANTATSLLEFLNLLPIASKTESIGSIRSFCTTSAYIMQKCINFLDSFVMGPKSQTMPRSAVVSLRQVLSGSSIKLLPQVLDLVHNKILKSNSEMKNNTVYGNSDRPSYNLYAIEVPIFLIYSTSDWLTTKEDALDLYRSLSPKARIYGKHEINLPNFNHKDFVYGKKARTIVYDVIFDLLKKIEIDK